MHQSKKATWYTIASAGIVFTVLACSSAQAKNTVTNYQAGKHTGATVNKLKSNHIQLIKQGTKAQKKRKVVSPAYPSPVFKPKGKHGGSPHDYPSPNY